MPEPILPFKIPNELEINTTLLNEIGFKTMTTAKVMVVGKATRIRPFHGYSVKYGFKLTNVKVAKKYKPHEVIRDEQGNTIGFRTNFEPLESDLTIYLTPAIKKMDIQPGQYLHIEGRIKLEHDGGGDLILTLANPTSTVILNTEVESEENE